MRPSGRARSIAVRASASGFAFALGLLAVLCVWHASAPPAIAQGVRAGSATAAADGVDVPRKARDILAEIQRRNGVPPPGYVGGRAFGNRERHLPRGTYREYDVNPRRPGKSRGTERIVIEQRTGKAYYSPDHYQTFRPMN